METKHVMAIPLILGCLFGVFGLAMLAAQSYGRSHAEQDHAQIELVWPAFMDMQASDRALIVGLAATCRVRDRPAAKSEVVACLEEATHSSNAILPIGVDAATARRQLDHLISEAADAGNPTATGTGIHRN